MLPDFLYIGGPRCGSTWIYNCLKEHPEIFVPNLKEVQYFNNKLGRYKKGINWYENFFKNINGAKTVGEISPPYLADEKTPKRIHKTIPNVKMIISIRNPIQVAYSLYIEHIKRGDIKPNSDIIKSGSKQYVKHLPPFLYHGLYYKNISNYLKYFPKKNFLFLVFDDLKENSERFIKNVFKFLKVDADYMPSVVNKKINAGGYSEGERIVNKLFSPIRFINDDIDLDILRRRIVKTFYDKNEGKPKMPIEFKNKLLNYYEEDLLNLFKLINRDMKNWMIIE